MKTFKVFVPVFLLLVIVTSCLTSDIISAESISDKVLRLHILANSDSTEDQNIKLGLKNYFLDNTKELFSGKTIEENIAIAENNKKQIENICNNYLKSYGKTAFVTIEKEFFKTRVYDDFTLPAGVYNSIKITIDEGKGHNWWCIVFPSVRGSRLYVSKTPGSPPGPGRLLAVGASEDGRSMIADHSE